MALLYEDSTGEIEALELELHRKKIAFVAQQEVDIHYKGQTLKHKYKPDLTVNHKVIVEIKALDRLTGTEEAQVIHYLKATGYRVALLINFGAKSLEWKRMVLNA